jgi:cell division septation protein DedD
LAIENSSPKISNNYFSSYSTLITVSGGSPLISDNVFVFDTGNCIQIHWGSPVISYNVIAGGGQNCYGIYTEGTAYISNNNITECSTGVYAVGSSTIQYNNIMGNDNGIYSKNAASVIQNNVLANNDVGITGNGTIRDNTIANNGVAGIWGPSLSADITRNNIYANTQNVHLTELDNITATYNWWGTTDASAINQTIWDHKNDPDNLGTLTFEPYLTEPNPLAPSIPSSIIIPQPPVTPTPTPTPTPSATPTSSPTPSATPTPSSSTPTPSPTVSPTETPEESPEQFDSGDMISVVVIVVAILLALIIIVFINRKYGKS